ncbi:S66 peptidase family protein [Actinoplanes sichuanensis]|uniref:LD-carboxypeptidase n=1 Tax=Actinoplanes sichuanensis TaxID=512349 RepID=A0ABW4ARJ1_9ACTN|nr:LD-carboxypeptidase [Actinoplanes sichuanensis]
MRGPRLRPGDRVRVVSPASFPSAEWAEQVMETLAGWGLRPELGEHALDRRGFLAGSDEDRLADVNAALRDPGVRAVVAATGGAGAYRIVDGLDLAAVRADPKPVVGFSDITNLHLALWTATGSAGVHGCVGTGGRTDESCRRLLFETEPITLWAEPSPVTVAGRATGVLVGGNAVAVSNFLGAGLPRLDGVMLCLEGPQNPHFDRMLWGMSRAGLLDGIRGVAIGDLTGLEPSVAEPGPDQVVAVVCERLGGLGVPILGGLPFGHVADQVCLPVGVDATLDAHAGTLTADSAVC